MKKKYFVLFLLTVVFFPSVSFANTYISAGFGDSNFNLDCIEPSGEFAGGQPIYKDPASDRHIDYDGSVAWRFYNNLGIDEPALYYYALDAGGDLDGLSWIIYNGSNPSGTITFLSSDDSCSGGGGGGGGGGTVATTSVVYVDDYNNTLFNGFLVFFLSMFFVLWVFKKRS